MSSIALKNSGKTLTPASSDGKLAYVDALRGLAVLMVVAVHTAQKIPGLNSIIDGIAKYCQTGVQLFFVASAYTLCIAWEKRRLEPHATRSFFIRRFFRIAPLYYIAIPIYFAIHLGVQVLRGQSNIVFEPYSPRNIAANLLFIHGFVKSANNSIVPGGWSIGAEMAFYLLFPLLFKNIARLTNGRAATMLKVLLAAVALNLLYQAVLSWTTSYGISNSNFTYFNLVNQLPVFLVGFGAYYAAGPEAPAADRKWSISGFVILSLLTLAIWSLKINYLFALTPTLAGISFFFLLQFTKSFSWEDSWLVRVGQVSFSIYIFHFIFAWVVTPVAANYLLKVAPHANTNVFYLLALPVVCWLSFSLAKVSYRLIEVPGSQMGVSLIRKLNASAR